MENDRIDMSQIMKDQLNGLKTRWLAHANEAQRYKELYEEANLFLQRALERLPEGHPLRPDIYPGLVSDQYLSQLAEAFEELDTQSAFDPELDEVVGIEEIYLPDEYKGFNVKEWNDKAFEAADEANESEENVTEEDTNAKDSTVNPKADSDDLDEQRMDDEGGMIYGTV